MRQRTRSNRKIPTGRRSRNQESASGEGWVRTAAFWMSGIVVSLVSVFFITMFMRMLVAAFSTGFFGLVPMFRNQLMIDPWFVGCFVLAVTLVLAARPWLDRSESEESTPRRGPRVEHWNDRAEE